MGYTLCYLLTTNRQEGPRTSKMWWKFFGLNICTRQALNLYPLPLLWPFWVCLKSGQTNYLVWSEYSLVERCCIQNPQAETKGKYLQVSCTLVVLCTLILTETPSQGPFRLRIVNRLRCYVWCCAAGLILGFDKLFSYSWTYQFQFQFLSCVNPL